MQTFADWLRYSNNLDVAPGLEALEKMRAFYTDVSLSTRSLCTVVSVCKGVLYVLVKSYV